MKLLVTLILASLLGIASMQAQELDPVQWSFEVEKTSSSEYILIYKAEITDGWNIYSQHLDDGGPVATAFTIEDKQGVEVLGEIIEPSKAKKSYDELFEMDVVKFGGNAEFRQKISTSKSSFKVKGFVTFMCCDDTKCLPPTDVDFEFIVE